MISLYMRLEGNMMTDELIQEYTDKTAKIAELERALEDERKKRSDIVARILDHGKGPWNVHGQLCTITKKKGSCFFVAVGKKRGRKAKPPPSQKQVEDAAMAVTGPMRASAVAAALGIRPGAELAYLLKEALQQGLITKTGVRAQTRYMPTKGKP